MKQTMVRMETGQRVSRGPHSMLESAGVPWRQAGASPPMPARSPGFAEYVAPILNRPYARQVFRTLFPLLLCDLVAVVATWKLAEWASGIVSFAVGPTIPVTVAAIPILMACGLWIGIRPNPGRWHPLFEIRQSLVSLALVFVFLVAAVGFPTGPWGAVFAFPMLLFLVPACRMATRIWLMRLPNWGIRCLVFGGDRRIGRLYAEHRRNAFNGLKPVGFLQDQLPDELSAELRQFCRGRDRDATEAALEQQAFCALVHRRGRTDTEILAFIEKHLGLFSRVLVLPDDHRLPSHWNLSGGSSLELGDRLLQPGNQLLKRLFDLFVCLLLAPIVIPLGLAIAILIRITSGGPVMVGSMQTGRFRQPFRAYRFRTKDTAREREFHRMLADQPELRRAWEDGAELPEDPRRIPLGQWLKRTGLEELPLLWNVLRGEMSLVGPRPSTQARIPDPRPCPPMLRVAPGLTGFWRISDPYFDSLDRRIELDDCYVRNWTLWYDLHILSYWLRYGESDFINERS